MLHSPKFDNLDGLTMSIYLIDNKVVVAISVSLIKVSLVYNLCLRSLYDDMLCVFVIICMIRRVEMAVTKGRKGNMWANHLFGRTEGDNGPRVFSLSLMHHNLVGNFTPPQNKQTYCSH